MRPLLLFLLGLSLTTCVLFPNTTFAKNDNVVFVCATEGSTQTVAPAPKQGFFGSLFGFLKKKEATTVYIDCSQKQVDSTKETEAPEEAEEEVAAEPSFFERLKKFFTAPSFDNFTLTSPSVKGDNPVIKTENEKKGDIQNELIIAELEIDKINAGIKQLEENKHKSKYAGLINIYVTPGYNEDPRYEHIIFELSPYAAANTRITLTGLTLKNARGETVTIPGATPLPMPGRDNTNIPVIIEPGARVILSSGNSPNGISFRENKCTGFFASKTFFSPSLSMNCPAPQSEKWVKTLSWSCKEYILQIPACQTPFSIPLGLESECQEAIATKINYNNCVDTHKPDKDFYLNTWRIYMNRRATLWHPLHETITLLDAEGKIIASVNFP